MGIVFAMHEAGFEVYDTLGGKMDINNDQIPEVNINKITSDFKLQKGDILVRNGHVNREYPQISQVGLSSLNDGYKIFCKDGNYNRVYRYIGDE